MEIKETEEKRQCTSCRRWFEEEDMVGDVCIDCFVNVIDEEDEL